MLEKVAVVFISTVVAGLAIAKETSIQSVEVMRDAQNAALEKNTDTKGFGPQAPRDLNSRAGINKRIHAAAPPIKK